MQTKWIAGVASLALLAGCGAAGGADNAGSNIGAAAQAQTVPQPQTAGSPPASTTAVDGAPDFGPGGIAGCYDANEVGGRTARVATRLGARPCGEEEQTVGDEGAAAQTGAAWIVGSWIATTSDCAGDIGISYNADGTYSTASASGRWSIKGQTLTLTTLETFEEGDDPQRLDPPRRTKSTIISSSTLAYAEKGADGKIWRMKKCR